MATEEYCTKKEKHFYVLGDYRGNTQLFLVNSLRIFDDQVHK
jgi:hypothetical protein